MKESIYKGYDDLPLFLNAKMVARVLGISASGTYELLRQTGFPTLRIGNRMVVPKEKVYRMGGAAYRRWCMRLRKNFFTLPNEIFALGLSPGELAVYAYLLRCENRRTYQCHPSYKTIGKAVGLSANTVRKYVGALADRDLIATENTSVITSAGMKRNGSLRYTILPIQNAVHEFHERQVRLADLQQVTPPLSQACMPQTPHSEAEQPATQSAS